LYQLGTVLVPPNYTLTQSIFVAALSGLHRRKKGEHQSNDDKDGISWFLCSEEAGFSTFIAKK
jgi:heme/copper-type cytochrome/quinol oxidase subunit 3